MADGTAAGDVRATRVVDAGSGTGRMAPVLSTRGLDYLGVDLSPVMVRTAGALHPGHRFVVGALTDLPLPDTFVDGVLCWYSIIPAPSCTGFGPECHHIRRVAAHGVRPSKRVHDGTGFGVISPVVDRQLPCGASGSSGA